MYLCRYQFLLVVATRYLLLVSAGSSNASGFCLHVQLLHSHNISCAMSSVYSRPGEMSEIGDGIVLSRFYSCVRLDVRIVFQPLVRSVFVYFEKFSSFLFRYFEMGNGAVEVAQCTV